MTDMALELAMACSPLLRAEIERLTRERDEWKEKWVALAQAALVVGDPHL